MMDAGSKIAVHGKVDVLGIVTKTDAFEQSWWRPY